MSGTSEASDRCIYQVHPSYKSETAIRITKRPAPLPQVDTPQIHQENPYVFKPKSYSKKRNFRQSTSQVRVIPPPAKKFKLNNLDTQPPNTQNCLDKKYISFQINEFDRSFFSSRFKDNQKIEEESTFHLPLNLTSLTKTNKNPLLSHKIEIVSTDNEKIMIQIHEDLLKANTNHEKQEQTLEGIVNPFNSKLKIYYSDNIDFVRDYKSGYTPIDLQNRSKKEDQNEGGYEEAKKDKLPGSNSKNHFIKKKQSTLSLSRTCGVSYIRPSQSFQQAPFEPLPPLIFQCSTSCNYTNQLRSIYHTEIQRFISLSETRWLPAIMSNEEHMRDILLGKPHGKVIWVHGLLNLWPLFNEGIFLLVFFDKNYPQTEEEVWKQFNTSYFKFGILAKKSTSGKKLFLKSIQADSIDREETASVQSYGLIQGGTNKPEMQADDLKNENEQPLNAQNKIEILQQRPTQEKKMQESPGEQRKQCKDVCQQFARELKNSRTVITMSLKFEMYVHESFWKGLNNDGKNLLNGIIHSFEQNLQTKAIEVIRDRLQLAKKHQREEMITKVLEKIKVGNDISHLEPLDLYINSQDQQFTLETLKQLNQRLEVCNPEQMGKSMLFNEIYKDKDGKENLGLWQKYLKMPIYYISTRDSFAFDLVEKITYYQRQERTYKKIQYFFQPDNLPGNYGQYRKMFPNLETGVVCYHDFFTEKELQNFEAQTLQTQLSAFKNKFLQMTVQPTIIGNRIKRTKFFFGYRYMWTRCQLAEPNSYVGAGVRRDVTPPPKWIEEVQHPMVDHGILEKNFLNSVAINVYHDGTEGLAQHFDDAVRFRQPIYTLRLVSDGRLSFGSQFYGFCNGAFIIPLPRGCICVMNESSYAANGVKHCVRPCDMSGKSAALILRQMHHQVVKEAAKYDELIDFPAWLSTMSENSKAMTFAEQKRRYAEQILNDEEKKKEEEKSKKQIPLK